MFKRPWSDVGVNICIFIGRSDMLTWPWWGWGGPPRNNLWPPSEMLCLSNETSGKNKHLLFQNWAAFQLAPRLLHFAHVFSTYFSMKIHERLHIATKQATKKATKNAENIFGFQSFIGDSANNYWFGSKKKNPWTE